MTRAASYVANLVAAGYSPDVAAKALVITRHTAAELRAVLATLDTPREQDIAVKAAGALLAARLRGLMAGQQAPARRAVA